MYLLFDGLKSSNQLTLVVCYIYQMIITVISAVVVKSEAEVSSIERLKSALKIALKRCYLRFIDAPENQSRLLYFHLWAKIYITWET